MAEFCNLPFGAKLQSVLKAPVAVSGTVHDLFGNALIEVEYDQSLKASAFLDQTKYSLTYDGTPYAIQFGDLSITGGKLKFSGAMPYNPLYEYKFQQVGVDPNNVDIVFEAQSKISPELTLSHV